MTSNLLWQVSSATDIGGGNENQDDYLVFQRPSLGLAVCCIFDGHGKETGKVAANTVRATISKLCEESFMDLISNPVLWLVKAHTDAHNAVKAAFRASFEAKGHQVSETPEGYLIKRATTNAPWSCVHGGSSSTVVVVLGQLLYIANVGDSSATLCANASVIKDCAVEFIHDAAIAESSQLRMQKIKREEIAVLRRDQSIAGGVMTDNIVLTAEHSPESVDEFLRFREFRPHPDDARKPAIGIVYDAQGTVKSKCPHVFELNATNGEPIVSGKGRYYKNVRQEWASLVHTPTTAAFQDALAFTRSIGDLHLNTYGITCLPEIQRVNLAPIFSSLTKAGKDFPLLCMVLCSDGVWDNWLYEDVKSFVMDVSCVKVVGSNPKGCSKVLKAFMQRNDHFGKSNFGSHADNATGVLMYISNSPSMPHEDIEPVSVPSGATVAPVLIQPVVTSSEPAVIGTVSNMNAVTMDSLTAAMTTTGNNGTPSSVSVVPIPAVSVSSSVSESVASTSFLPSSPQSQTVSTNNSNNKASSPSPSTNGSPISRSNSNGLLSKLASAGAAILGSS